jgi:hypothetical protein
MKTYVSGFQFIYLFILHQHTDLLSNKGIGQYWIQSSIKAAAKEGTLLKQVNAIHAIHKNIW